MNGYWQYVEDIKSGKIASGELIKLAVQRFENMVAREDMYLDEECIEKCIKFISKLKHFRGRGANSPFTLQPWQEFLIANVIGLKWKSSNLRVFREVYIQVARKAGKDALMAAICNYLLVADGEPSPQIIMAANSTNQANICFEYISKFAKQLDPSGKVIKQYRKSLKVPSNDGTVDVISSDPSKADGLNISCYVLDEYHEARDRKMFDVLRSSQQQREQPLGIVITTAGFNLDGPCYTLRNLGYDILHNIKQQDNLFALIYELDPEDDWHDEKVWVKCQPNLGVTVLPEGIRDEVIKADNDSTARVGVLTKTLNMWCSSMIGWIPRETVAARMKTIDLEELRGTPCIMGVDLSAVSDFTSISVYFPPTVDEYHRFKTWCFLPYDTYTTHPNQVLYRQFIDEGTMILTDGNVLDGSAIFHKIAEINEICPITTIAFDSWNAKFLEAELIAAGYNVEEFSQSIGNFNSTTKSAEILIKTGNVIIDKSSCVLWAFGNVSLKYDANNNCKPSKLSVNNKIDPVISMLNAYGIYEKNNVISDFEFTSVW